MATLSDFYAAHPQFAAHPQSAARAAQIDRAYPWFDWPGRNGARISQIVLDDMAAIANDQMTAEAAAAAMADQIGAQLPD